MIVNTIILFVVIQQNKNQNLFAYDSPSIYYYY